MARITKFLIREGIPDEHIVRILSELDTTLHAQISEEVLHTLDEKKKKILSDISDDTVSDTDFFALAGFSEKDVEELYLCKLEEYMTDLPRNIEMIKEKLNVQE